MKTKFALTAIVGVSIGASALASPDNSAFNWCTRNKQMYGYEAPDGPSQPCFQTDRYRGNGDGSRSVGVRRERHGVDGTHPSHPTMPPRHPSNK